MARAGPQRTLRRGLVARRQIGLRAAGEASWRVPGLATGRRGCHGAALRSRTRRRGIRHRARTTNGARFCRSGQPLALSGRRGAGLPGGAVPPRSRRAFARLGAQIRPRLGQRGGTRTGPPLARPNRRSSRAKRTRRRTDPRFLARVASTGRNTFARGTRGRRLCRVTTRGGVGPRRRGRTLARGPCSQRGERLPK